MGRITGIYDDTFPCASGAAIVPNVVVVYDNSNRGNVKLPAAANAAEIVGVAKESQSAANNVAVQILGRAQIKSDGSAVIHCGDWVVVADSSGRVKTQAIAAGSATAYNIVGMAVSECAAVANNLVDVILRPHVSVAA